MLPKVLITRKHPRIALRLTKDTLCVVHRVKYLDFIIPCQEPSDYVLVIPYDGVVVSREPMEPIRWFGTNELSIHALLGSELVLYELSVNPDGKATYARYKAGEEFLRGVALRGDGASAVIDVVKSLIDNYLKSSFLVYSAYIRSTVNRNLVNLSGYKVMVRGRVRVYRGDGMLIFREGLGEEESISLVSTVDALDDFRDKLLMLVRASRVIHDIRLGRVGHGIKVLLDMYLSNEAPMMIKGR
ncbi:hypothetical protein [Vulcanisaeta thermophila]|uniref:hypothetical protein n=1 Tax=Vulcanisaeta thermophila TaxID=867917 RepID=UPI000852B539|nr:hypothetical protein [Vulcanisaeta thermophila]